MTSAYPTPVDALTEQVRALAVELGELPSRNRVIKTFKVGAPKATAALDTLRSEGFAPTHASGQPSPVSARRLHAVSGNPEAETGGIPAGEPSTDVTAGVPVEAENTEASTAVDPGPVPVADKPRRVAKATSRRSHSWALLLIAAGAFVAIWGGWVGPEKRCGKSRLLDIVEATCHRPLITVNASPAAVYRSITADPPTMLVDEADTIFGAKADSNEGLRGLFNAGHQRNRPAVRYDQASNQVVTIPTFAMAALAGIGAMPDTIEDRAVVVRMRRRAADEHAVPYRHRRDRPRLHALALRFTRWLRADLATLERAEPAMPVEDRAADTWEPLVVVADHAGGHWPDRARAAAVTLTAEAEDGSQASGRIRLLADCRAAFGTEQALPTAVLLDRLNAPWADYGSTGLTPAKLAARLREFDIRPGNIRFPDGLQAKGYKRADFVDSWTRYCPDGSGARASQPVPAHRPVPARPAPGQPGRLGRQQQLAHEWGSHGNE